jgi:hypothetical protein
MHQAINGMPPPIKAMVEDAVREKLENLKKSA